VAPPRRSHRLSISTCSTAPSTTRSCCCRTAGRSSGSSRSQTGRPTMSGPARPSIVASAPFAVTTRPRASTWQTPTGACSARMVRIADASRQLRSACASSPTSSPASSYGIATGASAAMSAATRARSPSRSRPRRTTSRVVSTSRPATRALPARAAAILTIAPTCAMWPAVAASFSRLPARSAWSLLNTLKSWRPSVTAFGSVSGWRVAAARSRSDSAQPSQLATSRPTVAASTGRPVEAASRRSCERAVSVSCWPWI
jgi:hypothetical protein